MKKTLVPVIGIEVHVEPQTKSKMFCDCSAAHFGVGANTNVCPVCLGMPGALPAPNKKALEQLAFLGKALGCEINPYSYFERKNYFYPDLPKGYQISQYREPLCINGILPLPSGKSIRINRAHMEEDTAKMKHLGGESLIDFNRSGVPLIEIVSEADITSAKEAKEYLKQLARLIKWLGISEASMEKGTMRLEANVSVQRRSGFRVQGSGVFPVGRNRINPRVELKNINSFRFVEKAINFEISRQTKDLEAGKKLVQETRGWDEKKQESFVQRTKETSSDYRYFPEPDIPPMKIKEQKLKSKNIGVLPWEAEQKLKEYKLPPQFIPIITATREKYESFEKSVQKNRGKMPARLLANLYVKSKGVPDRTQIDNLSQYSKDFEMDDAGIEKVSYLVIDSNPKAVADFKSGKESAIHGLIGPAMRELKGKGNASLIEAKLRQLLEN